MFEKEAEENLVEQLGFDKEFIEQEVNKLKNPNNKFMVDALIREVKFAFQKGAEFGYNKANEWHYVKDELPIGKPYQNGTKAFVTVAYINNYNVPRKLDCYYWDNEFLCDSIYGYKKVEEVYGKVYAWKYEDKLPELKESE